MKPLSSNRRHMAAVRSAVCDCSTGDFRHMHWTIEQMLVHHTSSAERAMRSGDLIASGTVSGPEPESRGCLLERTWRGSELIQQFDGTERNSCKTVTKSSRGRGARCQGLSVLVWAGVQGNHFPADKTHYPWASPERSPA